ncbi:MAG: EAL domain-containing protein [Rhodospirillales bacterium]
MRYSTGIDRDKQTQESLLLEQLKRVRHDPIGYFAVHVHLSKLRPGNRQQHFLDIASRTFDDFIANNEALIYSLYNADLLLICRNVPIDDVDPVIEKVRGLFPEDPLTEAPLGSYDDRFSTWYDLSQPDDLKALTAASNDLAAAAEVQREEDRKAAARQQAEADQGKPLAPDNLAAINQKMKTTQIADLIRSQAAYRVIPGKKGEIVFREFFIAMAELKKRVAPNVNFFSSPWLFQYLTETLDRRMLAVIGKRNPATAPDAISLNLNIGTVMSREFQAFHEAIEEHAGKFIIEFQVIDIFADMNTYKIARDHLRERGYKVLVDGLNPLAINFFDPAHMQSDFLKIAWGPEFVGDEQDEKVAEMRQIVAHAGKDGVILSRVDSQDAIRWGAALGITRFQGHFIDKLVSTMKSQADTKAGATAQSKPAPSPAQAPAQSSTQAPAQKPKPKIVARAPAQKPAGSA